MRSDADEQRSPAHPQEGTERMLGPGPEVGPLQQLGPSPATLERAMGIIVAVGQFTTAEAWDVLHEISTHSRISILHVAQLIIEWGRTGNLCADIRHELDQQLLKRGLPGVETT